jgi:hypothetical protein
MTLSRSPFLQSLFWVPFLNSLCRDSRGERMTALTQRFWVVSLCLAVDRLASETHWEHLRLLFRLDCIGDRASDRRGMSIHDTTLSRNQLLPAVNVEKPAYS